MREARSVGIDVHVYLFVLAEDLGYASKVATTSGNPLDAKHFEYMTACVDMDDCVPLKPELALGDFPVFPRSWIYVDSP